MKKILMSTLTAGLAFAMMSTYSVQAEEISKDESKATITFEAPRKSVAPIDPENPKKPVLPGEEPFEPIEGVVTENGGPLSLDVAPELRFNKQEIVENDEIQVTPFEITSETKTYENQTDTPYLQVTDLRGTGTGWRVTAEASTFQNDKGENTLKGAEISFENGNVISPLSVIAPELKSERIILNTGNDNGEKIIVTASGNKELSEAQGLGTWLMRWFDDEEKANINLTVYGNTASPGTHTSTINWTLENGPDGK